MTQPIAEIPTIATVIQRARVRAVPAGGFDFELLGPITNLVLSASGLVPVPKRIGWGGIPMLQVEIGSALLIFGSGECEHEAVPPRSTTAVALEHSVIDRR
jgi:hypothetical protein